MQENAPHSTSRLAGPALLVFGLALFVALPAFADLIPPRVANCEDARVGAPCSTTSNSDLNGTCQPATCTRNKYDHDAEAWGEESYECLRCESTNNTTRLIVLLVCVLGGLGLAYYVRTISSLKAAQSESSEESPEEDSSGR